MEHHISPSSTGQEAEQWNQELHDRYCTQLFKVVNMMAKGGNISFANIPYIYPTAYKLGGWESLSQLLEMDPESAKQAVDSEGNSLLMLAETRQEFRSLLDHGINPLIVSPKSGTCLISILKKQFATYQDVQNLINLGVDINVQDQFGNSALTYAALLYRKIKFMRLLVRSEADPEVRDKDNNNLLFLLIQNYLHYSDTYLETKLTFLKLNSNIKDSKNSMGEDVITYMARFFHLFKPSLIGKILYFCDVDTLLENGNTFLMILAANYTDCYENLFRKLMKKCNWNICNFENENVTMILVKRSLSHSVSLSILTDLVSECDVHLLNLSRQNTLMLCTYFCVNPGCMSLIRILLDRGSNVNNVDSSGRNILFYILEAGDPYRLQKLDLFLKYLVSPTAQCRNGKNFLMKAAVCRNIEFLNTCLKYVNLEDLLLRDSDSKSLTTYLLEYICPLACAPNHLPKQKQQVNDIVIKYYEATARAAKKLNWSTLHPIHDVLNFILNIVSYPAINIDHLLNTVLFSQFKDVLQTLRHVTCTIGFYGMNVNFCSISRKACTFAYNTISVVLIYYLRTGKDPTMIINKMLDAGYEVVHKDEQIISPVTIIVQHIQAGFEMKRGDLLSLIKLLIQHGADVNQTLIDHNQLDPWKIPDSLYLAALSGNSGLVEFLLRFWNLPPFYLLLFFKSYCLEPFELAIVNRLYPVVKQWGPISRYSQEYFIIKNMLQSSEHFEDFNSMHSKVQSLKHCARNAVICTTPGITTKEDVAALELPQSLQGYVVYDHPPDYPDIRNLSLEDSSA